MIDTASLRNRAILLMREALNLLDEAGEDEAALHLQWAHDIAARVPPMQPGDELPEGVVGPCHDKIELPELALDPALVRAIGGALAVFATLMARKGISPVDETANALGLYAVATSETSAQEGLIIGCWGAILREVAQMQDRKVEGE